MAALQISLLTEASKCKSWKIQVINFSCYLNYSQWFEEEFSKGFKGVKIISIGNFLKFIQFTFFVCSKLSGLSFKHTDKKLLAFHSVQANYTSDVDLYFFKQLVSQCNKSSPRAKKKGTSTRKEKSRLH